MKNRSKYNGKFYSLIPDKIWEEIKELARQNLSVSEIMTLYKNYPLTASSIYVRKSHWGIKTKRKGVSLTANRKFSNEQEQEMIRLYTIENISSVEIARKFGCHPSCTQRILQRHNITLTHKGKASGIKNWNWKGGSSFNLPHSYRFSTEYKNWRKAIFERDNYTCQICGIRPAKGNSVVLNADHIKPQSLFPELRYELNNGRTLCKSCHKSTPTYGERAKKLSRTDFINPADQDPE